MNLVGHHEAHVTRREDRLAVQGGTAEKLHEPEILRQTVARLKPPQRFEDDVGYHGSAPPLEPEHQAANVGGDVRREDGDDAQRVDAEVPVSRASVASRGLRGVRAQRPQLEERVAASLGHVLLGRVVDPEAVEIQDRRRRPRRRAEERAQNTRSVDRGEASRSSGPAASGDSSTMPNVSDQLPRDTLASPPARRLRTQFVIPNDAWR